MCGWCGKLPEYRDDFSREKKHSEWKDQIFLFMISRREFHDQSPFDVRANHAKGKFEYLEICTHIENYEHNKNDGTDWCCYGVVANDNRPQWKHKISGILTTEFLYDGEYWSLR